MQVCVIALTGNRSFVGCRILPQFSSQWIPVKVAGTNDRSMAPLAPNALDVGSNGRTPI